MTEAQSLSGSLNSRWLALAEQRLEHLADLYESGRWRRYHTQPEFLENVREARAAVQAWRRMVDQSDVSDTPAELKLADITAADLVMPIVKLQMEPAAAPQKPVIAIRHQGATVLATNMITASAGQGTSGATSSVDVQVTASAATQPSADHLHGMKARPATRQALPVVELSPAPAAREKASENKTPCAVDINPASHAALAAKPSRDEPSRIDWTQHQGHLIQQRYPALRPI